MAARTADRSVNTCRSCRRRKIRCDRARPRCNRCRETGIACLYEDQLPPQAPSYRFVEESPGEPAGHSRRSSYGAEASHPITISSQRLQSIEDRVETLSRMVRTLQAQNTTSSGAPSSAARSMTDVSSASIREPEPSDICNGHLSVLGGGIVRYLEPSFWASMSKEVADLDDLLAGQARYLLCPANSAASPSSTEDRSGTEEESPASQRQNTASRVSHPFRSSPQLNEPEFPPGRRLPIKTVAQFPGFLQQVPSKSVCDALLNNYVLGYHPIAPLIHVPSFKKRYADFWENYEDANATTTASVTFATLMVGVCYAGAVASPGRITTRAGQIVEPGVASEQLLKLGMQGLDLSIFPRMPTLDTLTAYLLLQMTWQREEEPLACVPLVGLTIRVANMLGLHKDPSHYGDLVSPVEAEVRRRVWWQVVHVDTLIARASGLPPLLDLNTWDVKGISELKEQYIGTSIGMRYDVVTAQMRRHVDDGNTSENSTNNDSIISTAGILAAGKLRYTLVMRRALARLFSNVPLTTTALVAMRSEFKLLEEDLTWRISRIPEQAPASSSGFVDEGHFDSNPTLNKWARLLLSTFMDQAYSIICHPVRRSAVGFQWPELYSQAIQSCHTFCLKCVQLTSAEEFRRYHWSWPGNHQPLNGVMLLLNDLIETPDSAHATRSRKMIDLVFAMLGPKCGLVGDPAVDSGCMKRELSEGGNESWEHLRRLRAKVWRMSGLDPSAICTREEAIWYCNSWQETHETRDDDFGPPFGRASSEPVEEMTDAERPFEGRSTDPIGALDVMSPPDIDWDYLDTVLTSGLGLFGDYES